MATTTATKKRVINLSFNSEHLTVIRNYINDLIKIDEKILLVFNSQYIVAYSKVGEGNNLHAFKSHIIKDQYIKYDFADENQVRLSIPDGKKLMKILNLMSSETETLQFKIDYNEENFGERIIISNKTEKFELRGGDPLLFKIITPCVNDGCEASKLFKLFCNLSKALFFIKSTDDSAIALLARSALRLISVLNDLLVD